MARILLLGLCLLFGMKAQAETLTICYNYGCNTMAEVFFGKEQMATVKALFVQATTPQGERDAIARAIALFEKFAGQQTPTRNDKGGNYADDGENGRMDCIDESANATQYLMLLEARNWLRFHRVLDPVDRAPILVNEHWSASIRETATGQDYAVDSWFFDNGEPATIMPLDEWKSGGTPVGYR